MTPPTPWEAHFSHPCMLFPPLSLLVSLCASACSPPPAGSAFNDYKTGTKPEETGWRGKKPKKNRGGMRVNRSGRIERRECRRGGGGEKRPSCAEREHRDIKVETKKNTRRRKDAREPRKRGGKKKKKILHLRVGPHPDDKKPSATAEPLFQTPAELGENALEKKKGKKKIRNNATC